MLSSYAGKPYTSPTWRSTEWATGGKGPNAVAHAHRFRLRGCMRGESLSDPILTCVHCAATPSAKNGHATQHLPRPPNAPRVFGEMLELAFRLRIDVLPRASRPDRQGRPWIRSSAPRSEGALPRGVLCGRRRRGSEGHRRRVERAGVA
ncbi:hypothetical protein SEVIR_6G020200v4 [Setaria viridis]|uniref:Uncharacterized protein n=1 Tax=Setaria viridis TaxID=4556 RepID=A0A4U6U2L9_SETVI|nr:hypothetical protein SEVIR_6G020200v2 [Setaria viridis]